MVKLGLIVYFPNWIRQEITEVIFKKRKLIRKDMDVYLPGKIIGGSEKACYINHFVLLPVLANSFYICSRIYGNSVNPTFLRIMVAPIYL